MDIIDSLRRGYLLREFEGSNDAMFSEVKLYKEYVRMWGDFIVRAVKA
jgi:hypothetical protein